MKIFGTKIELSEDFFEQKTSFPEQQKKASNKFILFQDSAKQ
jgi:hypothetical protein